MIMLKRIQRFEKCPDCDGKGKTPDEHPHNGSIMGWDPCDKCNKTGQIWVDRELNELERLAQLEKAVFGEQS